MLDFYTEDMLDDLPDMLDANSVKPALTEVQEIQSNLLVTTRLLQVGKASIRHT
jgi:hypothetical protein